MNSSGRYELWFPGWLLVRRRENLIKVEEGFFLGLLSVQRHETFSLESALDAELIGRVTKFRQVNRHFSGIGVEVTPRNQVADVVGVPFLGELIVKSLDPQWEGIVNADNGLAGKEHKSEF